MTAALHTLAALGAFYSLLVAGLVAYAVVRAVRGWK